VKIAWRRRPSETMSLYGALLGRTVIRASVSTNTSPPLQNTDSSRFEAQSKLSLLTYQLKRGKYFRNIYRNSVCRSPGDVDKRSGAKFNTSLFHPMISFASFVQRSTLYCGTCTCPKEICSCSSNLNQGLPLVDPASNSYLATCGFKNSRLSRQDWRVAPRRIFYAGETDPWGYNDEQRQENGLEKVQSIRSGLRDVNKVGLDRLWHDAEDVSGDSR
jgi:hypothetical protein